MKTVNTGRAHLTYAIAAFTLISSAVSHAEPLDQNTSTEGSPDSVLQEVVVTAEKRSERAIDVPASLSVLSGGDLSGAGIYTTSSLMQTVPGLITVGNAAVDIPAIRGVSSSGVSPGDAANVAVYVDDVYQGALYAGVYDLYDIDRVEVLKGPQGTLFGRNATGGAIRIVTKDPSFTPSVNVSYDNDFEINDRTANLYATTPLSDTIAISGSGYFEHTDGYVTNIAPQHYGAKLGGQDSYTLRGKVLFRLSDQFKAVLTVVTARDNDNADNALYPVDGSINLRGTPGLVIPTQPNQVSQSTNVFKVTRNDGVSLSVDWDSEFVKVKSITAYQHNGNNIAYDDDASNLSLGALGLDFVQQIYTEELNFSGVVASKLNWLAGAYLYDSTAQANFNLFATDFGETQILDWLPKAKTDSYAGFADLTYALSDHVEITGGARYSWEKEHATFDTVGGAQFTVPGPQFYNASQSWPSTTYRGVGKYKFNDNANVYVSYSTGFKSGVFNTLSTTADVVDPEKINALEIGTKIDIPRASFTFALFQYDYSNIQLESSNVVDGAVVTELRNAAKARIDGLEFNVAAHPIDALTINSGLSALPEAKYTNFPNAEIFVPTPTLTGATTITPYNASGSRIVLAPKWQFDEGVTYTMPLAGGSLATTAQYSYNTGYYWQAADLTKQDAFGILNARLVWSPSNGHYHIGVFGRNLTNTQYYLAATPTASYTIASLSTPREAGITIGARF